MHGYLYALLSDLFFSSSFVIQKKYQQKADTSIRNGLIFNIISSAVLSITLFVICGFHPQITVYSFVSAFLQALVVFVYTAISFYIMKSGGLSLYTLFLMSGGMIVPFIWGAVSLGETISFLRIAGIILITASMIYVASGTEKARLGIALLCAVVFLVNGMSSVLSKLHQTQIRHAVVNEYSYMFWSGVFRFVMSLALLPFAREKGSKKSIGFSSFAIVIASAASGGLASYFNLMGASSLPAMVLYPLVTGGTIVLSFVFEAVVFKEKTTPKKLLPILICFIGTCMFV